MFWAEDAYFSLASQRMLWHPYPQKWWKPLTITDYHWNMLLYCPSSLQNASLKFLPTHHLAWMLCDRHLLIKVQSPPCKSPHSGLIYLNILPLWDKLGWFQKVPARDFPGGPVVRLCAPNAGGTGSIPGWGTKIPHATWCITWQKKKKKVHSPRPSPEYLMQDLQGLCGFQARECLPERKLNKDSLNDEWIVKRS